ncbi:hypothetical protein V6N13_011317 [Hibiscus sabdariffa]|uniref:Uncharacterized protein n=1 Tax=Hibiscus sabdariffa TaxID=183260 RepID=A0ABR2SCH8_9ROSI
MAKRIGLSFSKLLFMASAGYTGSLILKIDIKSSDNMAIDRVLGELISLISEILDLTVKLTVVGTMSIICYGSYANY